MLCYFDVISFFFPAAKPQIYLAPGPIYREEGTDVIMPKCRVTGFPKPVISWTKIFGDLSQQEHSIQDGILTLIKVFNIGKFK